MQARVALVTGGTSGIGRAITLTLARRGYAVVAFGNDPRYGQETAAALSELGLDALILEGDVANPADVQAAVDRALAAHGRIDVLCNNAAIRLTGNILETDEAQWDRIMDVDLKSMYRFTRAVLPHMIGQGGGVIINTASGSGYGGRDHIAYCTAKGGVFPFTISLAVDHAADRIRANAVVPGFTLTNMTANTPPERLAELAASRPAGRVCQPQDIANAVAFLVSDEAEMISGAILEVGMIHGQIVLGAPRAR